MSKNNKNKRKIFQKKIVKKFPCEDCLTLAICISVAIDETSIYGGLITKLTDKCSLIEAYIGGNYIPNKVTFKSRQMGLQTEMQAIRDRELHVIKFFTSKGTNWPKWIE